MPSSPNLEVVEPASYRVTHHSHCWILHGLDARPWIPCDTAAAYKFPVPSFKFLFSNWNPG